MKKIIYILFGFIILLIIVISAIVLYNIRDRHRGYELDIKLPDNGIVKSKGPFKIGIAKTSITPELEDTWTDSDGNARYEPGKGDTYQDNNGNGKFDAFWLAGFHNNRPATGIHDDIWARAVVFNDGRLKIAVVVLDVIGFFHNDVITVRKKISDEGIPIDHVIISSTHCHEVPDLMGLWGAGLFRSGVNKDYLEYVQEQTINAIQKAMNNMRPAVIELSRIDSVGENLVRDSRPPEVMDDIMHIMHFKDAENDTTIGTFLNWGDHPETLGDNNLLITADFAHYWLKGIEKGISYNGEMKRKGVGGIAIWANGAIGGLMTTLGCKVHDPWIDKTYEKPCFEKARAQGYSLAERVLDEIESGEWTIIDSTSMKLSARTFQFKVDNKNFKIGGALGVLNRGIQRLKYVDSEIDLLTFGNKAWLLTIPGEINPELVNGGIEVPEGADYPGEIVELPVIREMMGAEYNFVIGLGNDEVGYIMPKTHWDTEAPFTYGAEEPMYGEINSLGPETGPELHRQVKRLIDSYR